MGIEPAVIVTDSAVGGPPRAVDSDFPAGRGTVPTASGGVVGRVAQARARSTSHCSVCRGKGYVESHLEPTVEGATGRPRRWLPAVGVRPATFRRWQLAERALDGAMSEMV